MDISLEIFPFCLIRYWCLGAIPGRTTQKLFSSLGPGPFSPLFSSFPPFLHFPLIFPFFPPPSVCLPPTRIKPDHAKTEKVKSFSVPHDVTGVRQFIGLASYYRCFVPSFASIASPMHALTKKSVKFSWTTECQTAFDRLRELLISGPVFTKW